MHRTITLSRHYHQIPHYNAMASFAVFVPSGSIWKSITTCKKEKSSLKIHVFFDGNCIHIFSIFSNAAEHTVKNCQKEDIRAIVSEYSPVSPFLLLLLCLHVINALLCRDWSLAQSAKSIDHQVARINCTISEKHTIRAWEFCNSNGHSS